MNEDKLKEMNSISFWHQIELEPGLFTPGKCPHGKLGTVQARFGFPETFEGKTVLDIGCWDGLFSFMAEKMGATKVTAIDKSNVKGFHWGGTKGFQFCHEYLNSKVEYKEMSVHDLTEHDQHDIVFYFGVLYHLTNPYESLQRVFDVTKEYALIETAINNTVKDVPVFALNPGKEKDPTNLFYPNIEGLETALKWIGFKSVEVIYNSGIRATVKAIK